MASQDPTPNPFLTVHTGSPGSRVLRLVALLGTLVVLLQETITAFPLHPRQEMGLIVLVLAVPAVLLTLVLGMPTAWQQLRRHPNLLVPLGVLTLAQAIVGWLILLPPVAAILSPTWPLRLATFSLAVSAGFLLVVALNVAYAAWVTVLILNFVHDQPVDPMRALSSSRRSFLRIFALEFVGWAVLYAGLAVALALAGIGMVLAFLVIGVGSLGWNLATAALLPVAMDERSGFWQAFSTGIRVSWAWKGRWWKPVVVQMLLLGWVTLIVVSYTENVRGRFTTHNATNWAVNAFWTGGYENECRWYSDFMKGLNAPKVPVISTALGLVFGVLAIGVKLTVAERLWRKPRWPTEGEQIGPEGIEQRDERYRPRHQWPG